MNSLLSLLANTLHSKLINARTAFADAQTAFDRLHAAVPDAQRRSWADQEQRALEDRVGDPSAMDIFLTKVNKGWDG